MAYSDKIEQAAVILFDKRDDRNKLSLRIRDLCNMDWSTETFTSFSAMCAIEMSKKHYWAKEWSNMNSLHMARIWCILNADGATLRERIDNAGFTGQKINEMIIEGGGTLRKQKFDIAIRNSECFNSTEIKLLEAINSRTKNKRLASMREKITPEHRELATKHRLETHQYAKHKKTANKTLKEAVKTVKEIKKPAPRYVTYKCIVIDSKKSKFDNIVNAIKLILSGNFKEVKEEVRECN
nr:MAG TPA: hypothetical protein [Caudoviricetes sp.]